MSDAKALLSRLRVLAKGMRQRSQDSTTTARTTLDAKVQAHTTVLQEQFINRVNEAVEARKHTVAFNTTASSATGGGSASPFSPGGPLRDEERQTRREQIGALDHSYRSSSNEAQHKHSHRRPHANGRHRNRPHQLNSSRDGDHMGSAITSATESVAADGEDDDDEAGAPSTRSRAVAPNDHEDTAESGFDGSYSVDVDEAGEGPADADGTVHEGVRTLALYNSVNPVFFCDCMDAIWEPEPVEIFPQEGTSFGATTDDFFGSQAQDAFVVPSLPLGGGVRLTELRELMADARKAPPPARPTRRPLLIDEIRRISDSELRGDDPQYVEIDATVQFNRHRATEERRPALQKALSKLSGEPPVNCLELKVLFEPFKTGFEDAKEFELIPGRIIADRYEIVDVLGQGTFCRVVRCFDLHHKIEGDDGEDAGYNEVCLKFVNNSKDFFDQSLDEIKILTFLRQHADPDEVHIVSLIDYFYYKEHMVIVTELLSDNLYEYQKYDREHEGGHYFSLHRLQKIAFQITTALAYVHSLGLIHSDLKPENVLFRSHRRCEVKVIDFGSSCFQSDHLSTYIQSRSYRAPEVPLGCDYDGRIDVWSLGAILVELVTAEVLFSSETVPEMLARIASLTGTRYPRHMLYEGSNSHHFVNRFGAIFEKCVVEGGGEECIYLYSPEYEESVNGETHRGIIDKLAAAGVTDALFIDFVKQCLTIDHKARPTSKDLLNHDFLAKAVYEEENH